MTIHTYQVSVYSNTTIFLYVVENCWQIFISALVILSDKKVRLQNIAKQFFTTNICMSQRILLGEVAYVILFLNSPVLGYFRKIFSDRSFWNMNIKPNLQDRSWAASEFVVFRWKCMLWCLWFTKNVHVLFLQRVFSFSYAHFVSFSMEMLWCLWFTKMLMCCSFRAFFSFSYAHYVLLSMEMSWCLWFTKMFMHVLFLRSVFFSSFSYAYFV